MPEAAPSPTPKSADELSAWQQVLTSALLVLFTVLVAAACIVALACTLTQTRIATLVIDGVAVGIPRLDYAGRKWVRSRGDIESDTAKLRDLEDERGVLTKEATRTENDKKAKRSDIEDVLAAFYHRIEGSEPALAKAIRRQGYADQYGRIVGAKVGLIERNPALAEVIVEIEDAYKAFRLAEDTHDAAQSSLALKLLEIKSVKDRIEQTHKSVFDVIKADLDKDARPRIENAFYELNINNYGGNLFDHGFYFLLTLRPDLLTLTLVILMGVLGSALQISHAYFMKKQVQTIGGYFQRITVGAMTALVIFIVAKAGVPVLADPSRLAGDAPINPYFISFLAIISGLLSENAITNIQAQGARLFGGAGAEPNRWVRRDLTDELQAKGVTIAELAGHLGVGEDTASEMLQGKKAIEPAQQKIIAISLRLDPRDIFTDIPPSK